MNEQPVSEDTQPEDDPAIGEIPFGDIVFKVRRSQLTDEARKIYDEVVIPGTIKRISVSALSIKEQTGEDEK